MDSFPNKTTPSTVFTSSLFLFLVMILSPTLLPGVAAQPSNNNNNNNNDSNNNLTPYANFSPSMAIIIVVLVAALFFMGFFSIYIRHCSDPNSSNTVRTGILSVHGRRGQAAPRGLDPAVLETFPTFTYAEVKDHKIGKGALECAVCLNEFEDNETLRLIPKCDHVFHPECIDAWLQSHVTCPVCRANLNTQPGEEGTYWMPDVSSNQDNQETNGEGQRTDGEAVQVVCEDPPERQEAARPEINRNFSFDPNRPPRSGSMRRGLGVFGFGRFRSHSTGHSFVQPATNVERFTLRLPEEKRKEMMDRALLNRTKSYAAQSSGRGYRIGGAGEGSSRGARSYRRIERLDRAAQSDRWVFARANSFFSRALSIRSPRDPNGEGSSSKGGKTTVRMPSIKCLEPKAADETGLVAADSARPPV